MLFFFSFPRLGRTRIIEYSSLSFHHVILLLAIPIGPRRECRLTTLISNAVGNTNRKKSSPSRYLLPLGLLLFSRFQIPAWLPSSSSSLSIYWNIHYNPSYYYCFYSYCYHNCHHYTIISMLHYHSNATTRRNVPTLTTLAIFSGDVRRGYIKTPRFQVAFGTPLMFLYFLKAK